MVYKLFFSRLQLAMDNIANLQHHYLYIMVKLATNDDSKWTLIMAITLPVVMMLKL